MTGFNNDNDILQWFRSLSHNNRVWWLQIFQEVTNNGHIQRLQSYENQICCLIDRINKIEQHITTKNRKTNIIPGNQQMTINTSPTSSVDIFPNTFN